MQQVNLLTSLPEQAKVPFAARKMTVALLLFIMVLALYSAVTAWHNNQLVSQVKAMKQQQRYLAAEVIKLEKQHPALDAADPLSQEVEWLAKQIVQQQTVLEFLRGGREANTEGFSRFFYGLAQLSLPGVWLEAIAVKEGNQSITLKGHLLRADGLTSFVNRIAAIPAFSGRDFKLVRLQQKAVNDKPLDFVLSSQHEEENNAETT